MKNGESIDDFVKKLTTIVSNICSLGDKLEEISIVKKFVQVVLLRFMELLPPSSISKTSRTCRLRRSLVLLRSMRIDFMATTIKRRRSVSYSHMRSSLHGRKWKMWLILPFQIKGYMTVTIRKVKIVGMATVMSTKEVETIPHKPMTMLTTRRIKAWSSVTLMKKYEHYAVEYRNKECRGGKPHIHV